MIIVERIVMEEFAELRDDWNRLLWRSPARSPMLTWEWMFTWWECYEKCKVVRELYVLTARLKDRTLVGIAPLVLRPFPTNGIRTLRLEFLGTGEASEDETCSEFLDLIVDPQYKQEVIDAFTENLVSDRRWDEIVLRDILTGEGDTQVEKLAGCLAAKTSIYAKKFGAGQCPRNVLPGTWDEYLSSLTAKRAKRIEYERRHLRSAASVEFTSARDVENIRAMMPDFIRLHQKLWESRGKPGCFASAVFGTFIEKVSERLAENGHVQISSLMVDGKTVTVFYLFSYEDALYYYNSGTEPEQYREYSPGNITISHIIEEAIQNKLSEFHFFKASEGSYKYHWTDESVPVCSFLIRRKNIKHYLLLTLEKGRQCLKALKKEEEIDNQLGKVGEGVEEQLSNKRVRHGGDLDSLDGIFD